MWPKPIHLCEMEQNSMGYPQWDPNDMQDQQAEMPIITPAYPAMNSTFNVSRCTREVRQCTACVFGAAHCLPPGQCCCFHLAS